MIKFILLGICLISIIRPAYLQNEECVQNYDGSPGVCVPSNRCPYVVNLYRQNRIRPTICGFSGRISIVCCPENQVNGGGGGGGRPITPSPNNERISQRKCREYKQCSTVFRTSIVGGINSNPGEFPHMAALGWPLANGNGFAWNCGGSLISENYVISAAHCTEIPTDTTLADPRPTTARLGESNLKSDNDGVVPQDIQISDIIIHPQYAPPAKYHDIALFRLARPATFAQNVRPICLWQSSSFPSQTAVATGWGRVGSLGPTSDTLQKVDLSITNMQTCATFYSTRRRQLPRGIINEQLCAGEPSGGKDTCQGDSGGPLQIYDTENRCAFHLIGITSFGVGCGGRNSPAAYTRVSSYIDWIESIVWRQ